MLKTGQEVGPRAPRSVTFPIAKALLNFPDRVRCWKSTPERGLARQLFDFAYRSISIASAYAPSAPGSSMVRVVLT